MADEDIEDQPTPGESKRSFPTAPRELWRRRRHLPHWERGGETYFVTVRFQRGVMSEDERTVVLEACRHWDGTKMRLHGAVVMPNHLHLLTQPLPVPGEADRPPGMAQEYHSLIEIMHSIKGYTAHVLARLRGMKGPYWAQESYDRIMRGKSDYDEKLNYMLNNPVKVGLVADGWEYPFLWFRETALERLRG